jgi:3-dehydroquinate synthase
MPVTMTIRSRLRDYDIVMDESVEFLKSLEQFAHRCYVIDANVWRLYADSALKSLQQFQTIVLPVDEERKCLDSVVEIYQQLIARSAKRNLTLISIGGGTLQDISGFAASTLYRGVNWIFVPTTLLAMADSCIGGKTSLNFQRYKNLIGTFYPPSKVFIHAPFLATLNDSDFSSGLGEVVKLHLIGGPGKTTRAAELLPRMWRRDTEALAEGIQNSLSIKQSYITQDEFDEGQRIMLNFGHCFGHALETTSDFEIPHGQAIVIGMLLSNNVACQRGLMSCSRSESLRKDLLLPTLRVKPKPQWLDTANVVECMRKDKKRTGDGLVLIMMRDNHDMLKVDDLTVQEVDRALAQEKEFLENI